jgi:predicted ATPase/DNA-binding SARP family transcriptional activator
MDLSPGLHMAQARPDYLSGVQVHDLGSLWVESDGLPVALNGRRMTSALSILLVNLNQKVRTDVLIESIWGNERSLRAPAALDTLLWRLRRVLDPGRPARVSSTLLRTEEQGYRLVIPPAAVDSWQFDAMARRISDAIAPRQPGAIIDLTESALGLWRGRPYDDVEDDGWLDLRRTRLLEQRLAVQEARVGALLQGGQPETAVAELVPILAEHPFVERLWGYRILGLYQSGRTAAALEAYAQVRRLLDRELGLRPGPDLQALQERILRHDRSLSGPTPLTGTIRGVIRVPRHRTTLVGRDKDVDAVAELLQRHRLVSLTGPVGCGKTRLAAAVAHHVEASIPGGVCFVDLSDVTGDAAVADRVQQTLRLEVDATNSAVEAVAGLICDREMLVILDNCEQVTSAVRALVAAVLECDGPTRVLVTSRRVLGAPDEVVYGVRPLDLPGTVSPECLSASPAVMLFVERAAGHGISVDLSGPHGVAVAQICQAVDGLPLGIELAAARAQVLQLHEIAASVAAHPMSLGAATKLRRRDGELTLGESIESSHTVLTEQERTAHRRLSVLPPGFTLEAAVAVCAGQYLLAHDVPTVLIGLARQSLLEATKPERPGGPSLFRQLVPIRAHAAQTLTDAGEASAVREALLRWISTTLAEGPRIGQSDGGVLDRRLEDNRRTITATLETAIAGAPSDDVLITLCRLLPYWWLDGKLSPETVRLVSVAAAAVGPGNSDFVAAAVVAAHGSFLALTQQTTPPEASLLHAVRRLRDAPPDLAIFAAELLLAVAAACWTGGQMVAANAAADGVRAYGELLDDDHVRVLAKAVHCAMSLVLDPEAAGARALVVLDECQAVGNVSAQIMCYHALYMAALFMQNGPEGLRWSAEAIRCQQEIGQRNAATTLEARGSLFLLAGNPHDAIRCYGSANLQYSRMGRSWPQIPGTNEFLAVARSQVSAEEFDQAWASGERLAASDLIGAWI